MPVVFFGLGSNLGDREKNILDAVKGLESRGIRAIKMARIIETDPVGGPPQGLFLNTVLKAETALIPTELLTVVQEIEKSLGRVRTVKDGPRTIDIDILLYDDLRMTTPELTIPHPRMQDRDFVMLPLKELLKIS